MQRGLLPRHAKQRAAKIRGQHGRGFGGGGLRLGKGEVVAAHHHSAGQPFDIFETHSRQRGALGRKSSQQKAPLIHDCRVQSPAEQRLDRQARVNVGLQDAIGGNAGGFLNPDGRRAGCGLGGDRPGTGCRLVGNRIGKRRVCRRAGHGLGGEFGVDRRDKLRTRQSPGFRGPFNWHWCLLINTSARLR